MTDIVSHSDSSPSRPPTRPKHILSAQILLAIGTLVCAFILVSLTWPTLTQDSLIPVDTSQITYEALLLSEGISSEQVHGDYVPPLIPHLLRLGQWSSSIFTNQPQAWFHHSALCAMILTLIACIWGCYLLYRRRDLAWVAGLLFTLLAAPMVWTPHIAMWHLPIISYLAVSFIYIWRKPDSWKSYMVLGFLLSQAILSHSMYSVLLVYAVGLSLWKIPAHFFGKTLHKKRQAIKHQSLGKHQVKARILNTLCLLVCFSLGLIPWLFKGQFIESPLDVSQQLLNHQWLFDLTWSNLVATYQSLWTHFLVLTIMLAMTWMSMHISGVDWSRRVIGMVILFIFTFTMAVHLQTESSHSIYITLVSLIYLVSHPWSAQGTFILLPFEPKGRRSTHLVLYLLFLAYPLSQSFDQINVKWKPTSVHPPVTELTSSLNQSTVQQELIQIAQWIKVQRTTATPIKNLWVWGKNTWPLYAQSQQHSSISKPFVNEISFEDPSWKPIPNQLRQEQTDTIVIEKQMPLSQFVSLNQLLKHEYRLVNASDYAWSNHSQFLVYVNQRFPRSIFKSLSSTKRPSLFKSSPTPVLPTTPLRKSTQTKLPPIPPIKSANNAAIPLSNKDKNSKGSDSPSLKPVSSSRSSKDLIPKVTSAKGKEIKSPSIKTSKIPEIPSRFNNKKEQNNQEGSDQEGSDQEGSDQEGSDQPKTK